MSTSPEPPRDRSVAVATLALLVGALGLGFVLTVGRLGVGLSIGALACLVVAAVPSYLYLIWGRRRPSDATVHRP